MHIDCLPFLLIVTGINIQQCHGSEKKPAESGGDDNLYIYIETEVCFFMFLNVILLNLDVAILFQWWDSPGILSVLTHCHWPGWVADLISPGASQPVLLFKLFWFSELWKILELTLLLFEYRTALHELDIY